MIRPIEQYNGLQISFNITEDCNLKCEYCYEFSKRPRDLSLEYAKRFIDIILEDPDPIAVKGTKDEFLLTQGLILDFIGGDALMRPQLCDDIISYFIFESMVRNHKWSTQWRISISTNGTLFDNPGVREFLLKYHKTLALGVSVDGCPTIHNANRSNSMGTILKNWDWYSWYAGTYKTTKSTLNRESIPYLFESLKFLHEELDLHYISQNFIFEPLKETAEDLAEFDRQMEMCVSYVLEHHHDLYWSMIDKHFNAYGCMVHPDDSWCGSGAMPALSTNGKIYGCFRFLPHTSMGTDRDYHIGDVWNGLDHKERFAEIRNQTRRKISPTKCFSCSSESSCAWCVAGAYMETGKFYRQTNICSVQQIQTKWTRIYHERLKSLELGSENQPSILR